MPGREEILRELRANKRRMAALEAERVELVRLLEHVDSSVPDRVAMWSTPYYRPDPRLMERSATRVVVEATAAYLAQLPHCVARLLDVMENLPLAVLPRKPAAAQRKFVRNALRQRGPRIGVTLESDAVVRYTPPRAREQLA